MTISARPSRRAMAGAVIALALLVAVPAGARDPAPRVAPLDIVTARGVAHFQVEIADTDATRERGLMFRGPLAPHRGMLFDFKAVAPVTFWMKNTPAPLDMLFIGPDGRIVSIARNARPMSEAPIASGGPVLGVLEVRGGRAAEIGAAPGDVVKARIFHP